MERVGKVYPNAEVFLERHNQTHRHVLETFSRDDGLEMLPADVRERTKRERVERAWERFREDIAVVYASLLAADRDGEAAKVAELAVKADESAPAMRLALVDMAIGAGEARPEHIKWIEEADEHPSLKDKAQQLRDWLRENLKE